MDIYRYQLPTTGAFSFADFCIADPSHASLIAQATQARADLRAVLKQIKRTDDDEKDHLRLIKVLDDYFPHLYGILACLESGSISVPSTPVFSWRTTLSAHLLHTAPRLPLRTLHAECASALLTYAMALSNHARLIVLSLGSYECAPATPDAERRAGDEKLNFAVALLTRASGVFSHLTEKVLPQWGPAGAGAGPRPPDLTAELCNALAQAALADAQSLAIRKLLSRAVADSALTPGPPLPRTHPSTALLAKLHLVCAAHYAAAAALADVPGKARVGGHASPGRATNTGGVSADVSPQLKRHLADASALHFALGHKWLGVNAGETLQGGGEAVGFLRWAKRELETLGAGGGRGVGAALLRRGKASAASAAGWGRGRRHGNKARAEEELESVTAFLEYYEKMNNSLRFQPVPDQADLKTKVPTGRLAVSAKPYEPPSPTLPCTADAATPAPKFDDGSDSEDEGAGRAPVKRTYAGAGSYF